MDAAAQGRLLEAEAAFGAGQLELALARLDAIAGSSREAPAVLHLLALVEKRRGNLEGAREAFLKAMLAAPDDAQLASNAANLFLDLGEGEAALEAYDRALRIMPRFEAARLNRAIALHRLGAFGASRRDFGVLTSARPSARTWSACAAMERDAGDLEEAARAYDRALHLDPSYVTALRGRARVALERGEPGAAERFTLAMSHLGPEPELVLGEAEALAAEGDPEGERRLSTRLAATPSWPDGQRVLGRIRWEAGDEASFDRDLRTALARQPEDTSLWLALVELLAGADLPARAADAAARGAASTGDRRLRLLEGVLALEAGLTDRAAGILETLPPDCPGRLIPDAKLAIIRRDLVRALELVDQARAEDDRDVMAWALSGLLWRATGDDRASWLHEQRGLVGIEQIDLPPQEIDAIARELRALHRCRAQPIGQSVRGGTQTRGRLFDRCEGWLLALRQAILEAVQRYQAGLPDADPGHPLLRHRDSPLRLDGSWSVRLTGGGFHIAHIHSRGLVSSACYLRLPETRRDEGWLEIGRPPANLGMDLPALLRFAPSAGRLVLFPSTLFHGTTPVEKGERLTVAFDLVPG